MNAILYALFSNGHVEFKGFSKCPAMFKGMESPGGHVIANRNGFYRYFSKPGSVTHSKSRNYRSDLFPCSRFSPDYPGAARAKKPFVCACYEKIAAKIFNHNIFNS